MSLRTSIYVLVVAFITYHVLTYFEEEDFDGKSLLNGKNVLVTGASSGIGEQMAYLYASYGANVFITARREGLLQKVVAKCKELNPGTKIDYVTADMSVEGDREKVVQSALAFYGDIDQLVLNHAYMAEVYRWTGSPHQLEHLQKILNVNFVSYVHLTSLALPALERTGGSVTVVGSISGRLPTPFMLEYIAGKFALDGFFSALRHEFKATDKNVSVTHCVIGVIETDAKDRVMGKILNRFVDGPSDFLLKLFEGETAENAGRAIISASTRRQGELYYPRTQALWLQGVVRILAPQLFESLNLGFKDLEQT